MFNHIRRWAMMMLFIQLCCVSVWATENSSQPQTSLSHTAAVAHDDAIQTFVRSDFTARRTMLNQWPASLESLDKLVGYIDDNQLYTDSSGNTYLLKDEQTLLSYPDEKSSPHGLQIYLKSHW